MQFQKMILLYQEKIIQVFDIRWESNRIVIINLREGKGISRGVDQLRLSNLPFIKRESIDFMARH